MLNDEYFLISFTAELVLLTDKIEISANLLAEKYGEIFMAKKYYKMTPSELLVFLTNFNTVADTNKAELSLASPQLTELQDVKNELEAKLIDRQAKQEAAIASTSALNQTVKNVNGILGAYNTTFKSNKAIPDSMIESLGFDPDDDSPTPIVAIPPSDLVVEGRSNGSNYIKFKRNGNKPVVNFILEMKMGDETQYKFVKVLSKTRFEHKNQTPGVRAFYRVKAVHSDSESTYSNEAVVYN